MTSRTIVVVDAGLLMGRCTAALVADWAGGRMAGAEGLADPEILPVEPRPAGCHDLESLRARLAGVSSVLAIGGGAVMDTVKLAVATLGVESRHLFRGRSGVVAAQATAGCSRIPLTVVPTTFGTGAEVSAVAVFHAGRGYRLALGEALRPHRRLSDPRFFGTLPDWSVRMGTLEIMTRLGGLVVRSADGAGLEDQDQQDFEALHDALTAGPDVSAREQVLVGVSDVSRRAHDVSRRGLETPFTWPLWYLAMSLAGVAGVSKMQAMVRLLPHFCHALERLPGNLDVGRVARLDALTPEGSFADMTVPVARGLDAAWGRADEEPRTLARRAAREAFRQWGGPGGALDGWEFRQVIDFYDAALPRP